jgi:hypothetical protein
MTDDIFPIYPRTIRAVNIVVRLGKNNVEKLFRRQNVVVCSNPKLFRQ